jgi:glycosyltransferase involved in cell wall biosynthesis
VSRLRVLLVVYAFPPAGGVGTLRAASLARYLPAEGIRLDVLTTRNPSSVGLDHSQLRDIPPDVTVHRTRTLDLPFALKKRLKSLIIGARPQSPPQGASVTAARPNLLKRAFQDLLLPDPQVTWLPILTRAARRIVRDRCIDLVMITGAPYSDYLLAERLRLSFPQLPIVLDFRDEWLSTSFDVASFQFSRSDRARRFAIKAEADAVKSATTVVAVTEATRREMRDRYPYERESKFLYIPNGFDATRLRSTNLTPGQGTSDKILVTYVGSLYTSTEPSTLVQALESLPPEIKSRFKLRFIGHIEAASYRRALLRLGEMVELKGYIPQHEALASMEETDYVLLISHDRLNVSAKFYDYIGAGKPILACVHPDGDIRTMLEDLQAGWWADSRDVEGIRQLFLDAANRGDLLLSEFQPDTVKIAQYERKVLAQLYARLLHAIARGQNECDLEALTVDHPEKVSTQC